jgi:hypothetical protein
LQNLRIEQSKQLETQYALSLNCSRFLSVHFHKWILGVSQNTGISVYCITEQNKTCF